jgi:hypothetical protein
MPPIGGGARGARLRSRSVAKRGSIDIEPAPVELADVDVLQHVVVVDAGGRSFGGGRVLILVVGGRRLRRRRRGKGQQKAGGQHLRPGFGGPGPNPRCRENQNPARPQRRRYAATDLPKILPTMR